MRVRVKTTTVVFNYPFELSIVDWVLPPGSYEIQIEEQSIPGISFVAYRPVRVTMTLPGRTGIGSARQVFSIDPSELKVTLERDAASTTPGDHGNLL